MSPTTPALRPSGAVRPAAPLAGAPCRTRLYWRARLASQLSALTELDGLAVDEEERQLASMLPRGFTPPPPDRVTRAALLVSADAVSGLTDEPQQGESPARAVAQLRAHATEASVAAQAAVVRAHRFGALEVLVGVAADGAGGESPALASPSLSLPRSPTDISQRSPIQAAISQLSEMRRRDLSSERDEASAARGGLLLLTLTLTLTPPFTVTAHRSPLTTHLSPSPLVWCVYYSLVMPHDHGRLPLTAHRSPLTTHLSPSPSPSPSP